eukprot:TRINITY_DN8306_c0_g3_i2.p2 TRINITY_DN8306_c0_g3~~TRINITY_DN8306_c0_g3_i2.p2  ORF type:complete len:164 (-),score=22.26 TRINITY_DN8306_c0_g3_i2:116-607(-)
MHSGVVRSGLIKFIGWVGYKTMKTRVPSLARDESISRQLDSGLDLDSHIDCSDIEKLNDEQYRSLLELPNDNEYSIEDAFMEDEREFSVHSEVSSIQLCTSQANTALTFDNTQQLNPSSTQQPSNPNANETPRKETSATLIERLLCAPYKRSVANVPEYVYNE